MFGGRNYEVVDDRRVTLDRSAAARFVTRQMELMQQGERSRARREREAAASDACYQCCRPPGKTEQAAFAQVAEELETSRQQAEAEYTFSRPYVRAAGL